VQQGQQVERLELIEFVWNKLSHFILKDYTCAALLQIKKGAEPWIYLTGEVAEGKRWYSYTTNSFK
jgi:hypothetical protein